MNAQTMLLAGSEAQFHELLKNWSICPPDEAKQRQGHYAALRASPILDKITHAPRTVVTGAASADVRLSGTAQYTSVDLMKVNKADKVVYVELVRNTQIASGVAGSTNEGGNTLYMTAFATQTPNHVRAYFLPWQTGTSVRITIPDVNNIAIGQRDSHLFFTAAINGCSIFFQGTPRNPTIFHSGGSPSLADGHQTAAFWQAVNDQFVAQDSAVQAAKNVAKQNKGAVHGTSVDRRMYVNQDGSVNAAGNASTNRATLFEQTLMQRYSTGKLRVEQVNPWGCVLGRRDNAGDWKFYLQENATIIYHQITKAGFLPGRGTIHTSASVSVPLHYREIFPNGVQHATIRRPLPKVV